MDDEHLILGVDSGDPRSIAAAIRANVEKAAMIMDQGDTFAAICTFKVEQMGTIADAAEMRRHIARHMGIVAMYLLEN